MLNCLPVVVQPLRDSHMQGLNSSDCLRIVKASNLVRGVCGVLTLFGQPIYKLLCNDKQGNDNHLKL